MKQKILFILLLVYALSATPARSDNTFVIRVQSETETVEQICDRLGLELVRSLDPISLETATSFEKTEDALSGEASTNSKKKKKTPPPSPEPPTPLPAVGGLHLVRASDALPALTVFEFLHAEKSIGQVVAFSNAKKVTKDLGYGRLDLHKALAKHWKLLEKK